MSKLREQVREMMVAFGQSLPGTPVVPAESVFKLRALLTLEETAEFVGALGYPAAAQYVYRALEVIRNGEEPSHPDIVDLVQVVDSLGDMHVVNEGAALAFGVDLGPVIDAIHATNMAKLGGPIDPQTGKQLKPDGWQPPDIEGELRRQGWEGYLELEFP